MKEEQGKPVDIPVKKFVINPDRLPIRFPHHAVIYWILVLHISDRLWVVILMTLILLGIFSFYLYRKSIEVPNKTR